MFQAFNGLSGKVQSFDKQSGRYDVLLISSSGYQLAKIKGGENLRVAVPPPPAQRPEDFQRMPSIPQAPAPWSTTDPRPLGHHKNCAALRILPSISGIQVKLDAPVGTVLLCTMGRGIGRRSLINKVEWLRAEVVRSGGHMSRFYDFPGELTAEVVDSALGVLGKLVQTFTGSQPSSVINLQESRI
eukprot:Skav223896  [mRNA]  locus=scaffold2113:18619:22268:+ [translate_table: standard]